MPRGEILRNEKKRQVLDETWEKDLGVKLMFDC